MCGLSQLILVTNIGALHPTFLASASAPDSVVCIFNRGFNRGWSDIQGKTLLLFNINMLNEQP